MSLNHQPIIAQCTPRGPGAIALIRISGDGCISLVSEMAQLPGDTSLDTVDTHTIHYGSIVNARRHTTIDKVLFLVMKAPRTFTGHDTVEITCHNNQFIIEQIIERASELGARRAIEGEFSQWAVLNNKMDLLQAEAINEVVRANTQAALKQSLAQLRGTLSHHVATIEEQLIRALAHAEASFEFIDEEHLTFGDTIKHIMETTKKTIAKLMRSFDLQQQLRTGARITLIGPTNAGKSSLFNALLGKKRAIVTEVAGTTRDTIEAGLSANGAQLTLIDSAGIRSTDDQIEQAGIDRSLDEAVTADIILLVIDGSQSLEDSEYEKLISLFERYYTKTILVRAKADLPPTSHPHPWDTASLSVSSTTGAGISSLESAITQLIDRTNQTGDSAFLLNERHRQLLEELEGILTATLVHLEPPIAYELVSHHLQDAIATIGQFTGKTASEQGMDAIFRTFCIGK